MTDESTPVPPADELHRGVATDVALVLSAAANLIGTSAYVAEKIAARPKAPEPPKIVLPPGTPEE